MTDTPIPPDAVPALGWAFLELTAAALVGVPPHPVLVRMDTIETLARKPAGRDEYVTELGLTSGRIVPVAEEVDEVLARMVEVIDLST